MERTCVRDKKEGIGRVKIAVYAYIILHNKPMHVNATVKTHSIHGIHYEPYSG